MTTITTIASSDLITNSRATINTNFANLNSDKIETSYIDTDTTLAANSDVKLASQKAVKAYVDANSTLSIASETTAGATHSLTTTATQRVVVWAKGYVTLGGSSNATVNLKYNGVTKDSVYVATTYAGSYPFSLMYTETPGAATANVTVENATDDIDIMVMKFNV